MQEWAAAGVNLSVATPWPERRRNKSDFNDTIKEGGVQAVRDRIAAAEWIKPPPPPKPHFERPHLSCDTALKRLKWVMSACINQVERNLECRDWMVEQSKSTALEVQKDLEERWFKKLTGESTRKKVGDRVGRYM